MVVIKRDGREVVFNKSKIYNAVHRAADEVDKIHPIKDKDELSKRITERLYSRYKRRNRTISVEEIQDDVETELMKEGRFDLAKRISSTAMSTSYCATPLLLMARSSPLRMVSTKR